jgi:hypothetical protein
MDNENVKKLQRLLNKQKNWEKKNEVENGDFTKLTNKQIDEWLKIENEIMKI